MRKINISNSKKRDALLGFETKPTRAKVFQVLKDGSEKNNIKILKSALATDINTLSKEYDDLEGLAQAIISSDIECDIETTGMILGSTTKVYANPENEIVFNVKLIEVQKDVNGEETSRKPLVQKDANISIDSMPISWSGKAMPKDAAVKKFVFSKHYQICHVNGLTYDFLYEMAKELTHYAHFISHEKYSEEVNRIISEIY